MIDKEHIAPQIAAVHDKLGEMYDSDEDVIQCDDDGNHLATAELQQDDASSHPSPALDESSVALEGSDSTEDSTEGLHPAIQNNLSGVPREVRNLTRFFNPNPGQHCTNLQGDSNSDTALIATMYGNPEPKTYAQALRCSYFQNWWGSMCIEFKNMENKKVWEITPKASVPKGRKSIGSQSVFAYKDNGQYRAHCVAKGFSQIPGKDFQENLAPFIADTSLHLLMVIKTLFKLEAGQFDIETAFLYGKLEEYLWMNIPYGYPKNFQETHGKQLNNKTRCFKLTQAIYCLVQVARQWWATGPVEQTPVS
jgi:hypothetical protein